MSIEIFTCLRYETGDINIEILTSVSYLTSKIYFYFTNTLNSENTPAAITADTGIVITQAQIILRVSPQRTADKRLVKPTPIIEPVMECVVEAGMPNLSVINRVIAPADSALTPSIGVILVIFDPMGFTIRHPPDIVPRAIAVYQA